jgi:hypothetical protein
MHRARWVAAAGSFSVALASFLVTAPARALDDCPPGSTLKNEDGFSWCEPKVCMPGVGCSPGEVCVPVPLCVQVGTTGPEAGAALAEDASTKRLVATQRCGPDNECPQLTTCLAGTRCVSSAVAERIGLLAKPAASAAPDAAAPAKKNCGCRVPGGRAPGGSVAAIVACGALVLARRRRRPSL